MDNSRHDGNARQRQEERRRRQQVTPLDAPRASLPALPTLPANTLMLQVRDFAWHVIHNTPTLRIGGGLLAIILVLLVLGTIFSPVVGYNVWALGTSLAGRSLDDANQALSTTWNNSILIDITLDGETIRQLHPAELGLKADTGSMAQAAMNVRWQGFPMGYEIEPILTSDYGIAQNVLLDLVDDVYIPAYDAGFAWEGETLVATPGRSSRELDLMLVLENIMQNPTSILNNRKIDLITKSVPPASLDSTAYLADATTFLSQNFRLIGYDPFTDEATPWTTTKEEMVKWLASGANGLTVREAAFKQFIEAVNGQLRIEDNPRYLDTAEAVSQLQSAVTSLDTRAYLRVRYAPRTMEITAGDWGQRIARRTGIPFQLIAEVNPNINWDQLSVGEVINIPTRDLLLPDVPIPNKRIIVDLNRRYIVAYEDGQVVMSWRVSVGRQDAPTIPGVFQVLTHSEKAYGSGFSLCGDAGCSQWEMEWFMGIYEVTPGLMNGFHGAVLLPNGAYLDDGQVGNESTFGCLMANNEQSKRLYDWAETGTIVEIVSNEYLPQSLLGQQALDYITQTYGV